MFHTRLRVRCARHRAGRTRSVYQSGPPPTEEYTGRHTSVDALMWYALTVIQYPYSNK